MKKIYRVIFLSSLLFGLFGIGSADQVMRGEPKASKGVIVTNDESQPVPVSVQAAVRQHYFASDTDFIGNGYPVLVFPKPSDGRLLVVERISADLDASPSVQPTTLVFRFPATPEANCVIPLNNLMGGLEFSAGVRWHMSQDITVYVNPENPGPLQIELIWDQVSPETPGGALQAFVQGYSLPAGSVDFTDVSCD